jgi:hypothetical protein
LRSAFGHRRRSLGRLRGGRTGVAGRRRNTLDQLGRRGRRIHRDRVFDRLDRYLVDRIDRGHHGLDDRFGNDGDVDRNDDGYDRHDIWFDDRRNGFHCGHDGLDRTLER